MVEQPYIDILAESNSLIKDHLLCIPTRLENIEEMMDSLEINNTTYMDKLRLFSGDNPARQLESGQQCGGI